MALAFLLSLSAPWNPDDGAIGVRQTVGLCS